MQLQNSFMAVSEAMKQTILIRKLARTRITTYEIHDASWGYKMSLLWHCLSEIFFSRQYNGQMSYKVPISCNEAIDRISSYTIELDVKSKNGVGNIIVICATQVHVL